MAETLRGGLRSLNSFSSDGFFFTDEYHHLRRQSSLKIYGSLPSRSVKYSPQSNSKSTPSLPTVSPSQSSKSPAIPPAAITKEAHKYFDQAVITVRSGDGGHGSILKLDKANSAPAPRAISKKDRAVQKAKQKAERGGPKKDAEGHILLPVGGHGGDVVLYADEFTATLLEFHSKKRFTAKKGGNVNSVDGLGRRSSDGMDGETVRIPVPVGTVVKRKRGGHLIADLCRPGDEVLVARGGRGGVSILSSSSSGPKQAPAGVSVVLSPNEKEVTQGLPGEELTIELTLRVVADVGLVGLPNAGKSSLLAAVTSAKPEIAAYPFTTLMPNLGRLEGDPMAMNESEALSATLADLPGLIEGAHVGKGLGRMFLRHLRRTRVLLHIVDASAIDPLADYLCLRQELWMYNEEYTDRPHVVVLNKLDVPHALEQFESLKAAITTHVQPPAEKVEEKVSGNGGASSRKLPVRDGEESLDGREKRGDKSERAWKPPIAVVGISAKEGSGIEDLLKVVRDWLMKHRDGDSDDPLSSKTMLNDRSRGRNFIKKPQWQV